MPAYQHVRSLFGGFDTSVVQIDGELSRQSTLAYAALHHIVLFTLPAAYHSPHLRLSHISTCTTCHRTCTTSVVSDASFCSWIVTMSLFDWLSVLPGPRPGGTYCHLRHLLALACYRITKVPDTMYQTKYPGPRRCDQGPTHWLSDPQSDSL